MRKLVKKFKVVSVKDLIDSRYFTIDETLLTENANNYYFPDYATYEIKDVVVDGVPCQEITFNYIIDASQTLGESVNIPLKTIGNTDHSVEGYLPTNYDPL